jgi:hypothetical protein
MENTIVLNPDDDYILSEGDELIVLAEDDNSYFPSKSLPKVNKHLSLCMPHMIKEESPSLCLRRHTQLKNKIRQVTHNH